MAIFQQSLPASVRFGSPAPQENRGTPVTDLVLISSQFHRADLQPLANGLSPQPVNISLFSPTNPRTRASQARPAPSIDVYWL